MSFVFYWQQETRYWPRWRNTHWVRKNQLLWQSGITKYTVLAVYTRSSQHLKFKDIDFKDSICLNSIHSVWNVQGRSTTFMGQTCGPRFRQCTGNKVFFFNHWIKQQRYHQQTTPVLIKLRVKAVSRWSQKHGWWWRKRFLFSFS